MSMTTVYPSYKPAGHRASTPATPPAVAGILAAAKSHLGATAPQVRPYVTQGFSHVSNAAGTKGILAWGGSFLGHLATDDYANVSAIDDDAWEALAQVFGGTSGAKLKTPLVAAVYQQNVSVPQAQAPVVYQQNVSVPQAQAPEVAKQPKQAPTPAQMDALRVLWDSASDSQLVAAFNQVLQGIGKPQNGAALLAEYGRASLLADVDNMQSYLAMYAALQAQQAPPLEEKPTKGGSGLLIAALVAVVLLVVVARK